MGLTPTRDYEARRATVAASLPDWGLHALLVTTPADLRYLLGYAGETPLGPNPFTGGPSVALLIGASASVCVLPTSDVAALPTGGGELELATYETFLGLAPLFPRAAFCELLADVVARTAGTRLGFQGTSLTAAAKAAIERSHSRTEMTDHDDCVSLLRMRKSADEILSIRRALKLCDAAQRAVVAAAAPDVSDCELLIVARDAIRRLAGADLPLVHTIASGPEATITGVSASTRKIVAGDVLLADIAPCFHGYWGDSCSSGFVGRGPHDDQRRVLTAIEQALIQGTEAVRAGVPAREIDATMRDRIRRLLPWAPAYHHHGGHGIGLDYHEPPRLVASEKITLEENMVIALEPAAYVHGMGGIRLEHVVLVTRDGCEVLSGHRAAW